MTSREATVQLAFRVMQWHARQIFLAISLLSLNAALGHAAEKILHDWQEARSFAAPEATQAAAADDKFVYAISNRVVAKYDRQTGQLVGRSTGEASHLNYGVFYDGKLYCAHSNYPAKPERSEIKVLDPQTMVLSTFKDLGATDGSLTWAIPDKQGWWLNFAHYDADNHRTYLARYEDDKETKRFTYPPNVIQAFEKRSASGGIWREGQLLVTGHDARAIYVLRLPTTGTVLESVGAVAAPFTGQGFADDPAGNGLIGIDRAKRRIIFAK